MTTRRQLLSPAPASSTCSSSMPTRPKPSVDYVKQQRAKALARPKEQAAPEIALCINGGGLTPPVLRCTVLRCTVSRRASVSICHPEANAEKLPWWTGVFRGLVKRKVAPRKSPNCNNALDNFDV